MTRSYNSQRRAESAAQTRQSIVEAAVKLHGEGITTLSVIAEAAGVSLPTLNKHFPTREDLFDACTSHVAANQVYPSPEDLKAIQNPGERLCCVVQEAYRLHEGILGQLWTGYKLEDESPMLARAIAAQESFVAQLADTLPYEHAVGDPDIVTRFVRAALSPLTYRALRVKNGLSMEDAVNNMTIALAGVLNIEA